MLLPTMVVDDEIRGDPKQKRARIQKSLTGRGLKQAQEGILRQIFGGLRTSEPAGEKTLQITPVLFEQRRQFRMRQIRHNADRRRLHSWLVSFACGR